MDKNLYIYSYLAGYIEGDGYIGVPKFPGERFMSGRLKYPTIQIAFPTKDLPLAQFFLTIIGKGSLLKKKGVNAYILTFNNKESILFIAKAICNYMRTPKLNSLNELLCYYNLQPVSLTENCLSLDAWLAGFIDADGSFQVRSSNLLFLKKNNFNLLNSPCVSNERGFSEKNKKFSRFSCSFELSQRLMDKSGDPLYPILNKIGIFLKTNVKQTVAQRAKNELRIKTNSLLSNNILLNYLKTYPLLSSKHLDFLDWCQVLKIVEAKNHKLESGKKEIIKLKLKMNNNRTDFNWDHLTSIWGKLI